MVILGVGLAFIRGRVKRADQAPGQPKQDLMALALIAGIVVVGFVIQYLGFPVALVICALLSLVGVLMIYRGFSFPIPVPEEETWGSPRVEPQIEIDEVLDPEIDVDDDMV